MVNVIELNFHFAKQKIHKNVNSLNDINSNQVSTSHQYVVYLLPTFKWNNIVSLIGHLQLYDNMTAHMTRAPTSKWITYTKTVKVNARKREVGEKGE